MPHPLDSFQFCPRCGSNHFLANDERSKKCGQCGFTYYHNASASTAAFITNEAGQLLVCRRALEPACGTLDLPGGFVDPGETLEEACLREVAEETGCKAHIEAYLFSLSNTYRYSQFDVHTTDAFFAVKLEPLATPQAADDAAEVFWMPLNEVMPQLFGLKSVSQAVEKFLSGQH